MVGEKVDNLVCKEGQLREGRIWGLVPVTSEEEEATMFEVVTVEASSSGNEAVVVVVLVVVVTGVEMTVEVETRGRTMMGICELSVSIILVSNTVGA